MDAELQEYEVVNDGVGTTAASKTTADGSKTQTEDWEKDVDDLLGDSDDLK